MVSFLKNFTKRVIACPSCGKRSRVPVKPGSVLLVTCPACETKFEIKFENPMSSLKNSFKLPWQKHNPNQTPFQRYLPILMGLSLLLMFKSCFMSPPSNSVQDRYQEPQTSTQPSPSKVFDM